MNIVLFTSDEANQPLPRTDARARHIVDVLRRVPGDSLDAGLINGPRGKATVEAVTADELVLSFVWEQDVPRPELITLIAGLCRPQTSRRVLREAATVGVARMLFVHTDRGESTYADSSLWTTQEYQRHVRTGVEQAFATQLPSVQVGMDLAAAMTAAPAETRIALDNYEGIAPLHRICVPMARSLVLAVGPERGWSAAERDLLRQADFQLAGLGHRVLRAETAVVAALSVLKARTGAWDHGPTVDTR